MTRQDFGARLSAFIELLEAARDAEVVTLIYSYLYFTEQ